MFDLCHHQAGLHGCGDQPYSFQGSRQPHGHPCSDPYANALKWQPRPCLSSPCLPSASMFAQTVRSWCTKMQRKTTGTWKCCGKDSSPPTSHNSVKACSSFQPENCIHTAWEMVAGRDLTGFWCCCDAAAGYWNGAGLDVCFWRQVLQNLLGF